LLPITKISTKVLLLCLLLAFSKNNLLSNNSNDTIKITEEDVYPNISLVLSGGGARGLTQIGVIEEMESNGLFPKSVIGTSIGAIIGGIYSTGYSPKELDSIANFTNWNELFSLTNEMDRNDLFIDQKKINDRSIFNLRFNGLTFEVPKAVSGGGKFNEFLQTLFWNAPYQCNSDFNKLKYPYRAIATDLVSGQSINLQRGDLITSIKASATVPLRYLPVLVDTMVLVDGGILCNIPIEHAKEFKPDMIIAVNSSSPLFIKDELETPWNIADQTISILIKKMAAKDAEKADILITPEIGNWKNTDYSNPSLLIDRGRTSFNIYKSNILNKFDSIYKSNILSKLKLKFGERNLNFIINKKNYYYPADMQQIANLIAEDDYFKRYGLVQFVYNQGSNCYNFDYPNNYINDININFIETKNDDKSFEILTQIRNTVNTKYDNYILTNKIKKEIIEAILKICRANSYSFASVSKFQFSSDGSIDIEIDKGIITKINVLGNKQTKEFLILRELSFQVGEPANAIKLNELYDNLIATEYFNYVFIDVKKVDDSGLELNVNVDEKGTNNLRVSAKIDNQRYTQGNAEFVSNNFLDRGARTTLRMAGGQRNFLTSLTLGNPRILTTNLAFEFNLFYKKRDIFLFNFKNGLPFNEFERLKTGGETEEKTGANFSFGSQLNRLGNVSIGVRHEFQRIYNSDANIIPKFINFTNLKLGTEIDTKDNSDFATKGVMFQLAFQSSLNPKSEVSFSKFDLNYENYFSIGSLVMKPSLLLGFADKTLPRSEFYTMGGIRNFFGMNEDEERGRQIFAGSLEFRYKMPFKIIFDSYLSFRYDLGKSWVDPESIKFETLKHGIGAILSLDTPLGPAKFALGKSFYFISDPNSVVQGPLYGYFSLGVDFGY